MYIDEVVIAGVIVVVATLGFFGGVGYWIRQDLQKNSES